VISVSSLFATGRSAIYESVWGSIITGRLQISTDIGAKRIGLITDIGEKIGAGNIGSAIIGLGIIGNGGKVMGLVSLLSFNARVA